MRRAFLSSIVCLAAFPGCGGAASSDPAPPSAPAPAAPSPLPGAAPAPPAPTSSAGPTVIHEDDREVTSLAVDADAVYWTMVATDSTGAVARWSKRDGSFQILAGGRPSPMGIALDGDAAYWVDTKLGSGAVVKVSRTGGTPTVLATSDAPDSALVVRDALVYFVDGRSDGELRSVPTTGGASSPIAQLTGAVALTSDATDFFFLFDGVMKLATTGGAPVRISEPCFYPNQLAVDASRAFWACQDGTVRTIQKSGGASTKLFSRNVGGGNIGGLAIDDANVYFTSQSDGAVDRVAKEGGAVATLVADVAVPGAIAVDDAFVYYAVRGKTGEKHRIERVAK